MWISSDISTNGEIHASHYQSDEGGDPFVVIKIGDPYINGQRIWLTTAEAETLQFELFAAITEALASKKLADAS